MSPTKRDLQARDERVRAAYEAYLQGKLSRRDLIRYVAVMGTSLAALGLAACSTPTPQIVEKVVEKPVEVTKVVEKPVEVTKVVEKPVEVTKVVERLITPTPVPTPLGGIRRGGKLVSTMAYSTERINDPALAMSTFVANTYRQVCDWLVRVTPDMVVRPALATKWTPSADGKDWTIELRKGVKFNHGKPFTADDVVFTFNRLLDPSIKSAFSSVANYLKPGSIEKKDDYTVIFHCERVVADFPYHLFDYHAPILPADWGGDFYKQPWGTGPFTIKEYRPDERIIFTRREDYWDLGVDGKPLPYLDQVEVRGYPDDASWLDALKKGELHLSYVSIATLPQVLELKTISPKIIQTSSFWNGVLHCDEKPFSDPRVRKAFKLSIDREKYIRSVLFGYGVLAADHPIGPIYDGAPDIKPPARNIEQAKALLKDAGYPDGIDLKMQFYADDGHTNLAQWMQASVKEAGFRLTLAPNPDYYQVWLNKWGDNVMGADNWATRATPSEYFNIAYKTDGDWNETHWSNAEFDKLLAQYDAELDAAKRKEQLKQLCTILSEDGGVIIPSYRQELYSQAVTLQGFTIHPLVAMWYADLWLSNAGA